MDDLVSLQIRILSDQAVQANARLDKLADTADRLERNTRKSEKGVNGVMARLRDFTVVAGGAARAAQTLWRYVQVPLGITGQFQKLQAQLTTATGSVDNMAEAWAALADFASDTPFTLQDTVGAFTKLVNYGLTPSERALKSYGDTAAATGKEFDQLVEAVADAVNGEFERTKEAFNVKAKNMGDTIAFRFRGVTTEVKNNAEAIEEYFIKLGETNFEGGMSRQMDTLTGKLSNLEDAWEMFWFTATTSSGAADLYGDLISQTTEFINEMEALLSSGQAAALWESQRHQIGLLIIDMQGALEEARLLVDGIAVELGESESDWEIYTQNIPLLFRAGVKTSGVELYTLVLIAKEVVRDMGAAFSAFPDLLEGYIKLGVDKAYTALRTGVDAMVSSISGIGGRIGHVKALNDAFAAGTITAEQYSESFGDVPKPQTLTGMANAAGQVDALNDALEDGTITAAEYADQIAGIPASVPGGGISAGLFPDARSQVDRALAERDEASQRYEEAMTGILETRSEILTRLNEQTVDGVNKTTEALAEADAKRAAYDAEAEARRAEQEDRLAQFKVGGGAPSAPSPGSGGGSGGSKGAAESFDQLQSSLAREEEAIRASYERRLELIRENTAAGSAAQAELSLSLVSQYEEEALAAHDRRKDDYDNLLQWLGAERDLVKQMYEERRQIIVAATELTEEQKLAALEKAQRQYAAQMQSSFAASSEEYLNAASGLFRDLSSMGDAFGKTGFKVAQGAAIAEATIAMYTSAVNAYKTGSAISPFLGPVFAAAALAAGAANIARIKSQTYQGGGGSAGMFEHGGLIPAGKVGVVGEAGPEFIRGPVAVTSARTTADARKSSGGGKEVVVNIHNHAGATVETRRSETDDKQVIDVIVRRAVEAVANDIRKGGGPVSRAQEGTYNLGRGKRAG